MGIEIERKFLLRGESWRELATHREAMRQGYVASGGQVSVRVRVAGESARLNIKAGGLVAVRREYEWPIPLTDAIELLDAVCERPLIEKTRYWVPYGGFEWEVDEFHGDNTGLVVAELELDDEAQEFPRPEWVGREVTELARYYNVNLVTHPFSAWSEQERNP